MGTDSLFSPKSTLQINPYKTNCCTAWFIVTTSPMIYRWNQVYQSNG